MNGTSICLVDYDIDSDLAFLSGKGEGNISMFEFDKGNIKLNGHHTSKDYGMSTSLGVRRCVDTSVNEVARAFKLGKNYVEEIQFLYPRKDTGFAHDLYPDCRAEAAALTADEWLGGANKDPVR
jgi:hypothetical protein